MHTLRPSQFRNAYWARTNLISRAKSGKNGGEGITIFCFTGDLSPLENRLTEWHPSTRRFRTLCVKIDHHHLVPFFTTKALTLDFSEQDDQPDVYETPDAVEGNQITTTTFGDLVTLLLFMLFCRLLVVLIVGSVADERWRRRQQWKRSEIAIID